MSMLPIKKKVYDDGRTKQAFKDDTDINRLLARAQQTGSLSHLAKYEPVYGDFVGFDFFEAQQRLARGRTIFEELPTEIRKEFGQDAGKFFEFVNAPENVGKLDKIFPEIAEPGKYFPDVSSKTPPGALLGDKTPEVPEEIATPPESPPEP